MAAAETVDEVDRSLSPLLAGGDRPSGGPALPDPRRFALRHVLSDEGFVFLRYLARGRADLVDRP